MDGALLSRDLSKLVYATVSSFPTRRSLLLDRNAAPAYSVWPSRPMLS